MISVNDSTDFSPVCATFNDTSNDTSSLTYGSTLTLQCPISHPDRMVTYPFGRYVTIKSNGGPRMRYLSMCDVIVTGFLYTDSSDRASNKTSRQSGIRKFYTADRAVDSDTDTCSFAETSDEDTAWWQVDLGRLYNVAGVSIVVNDEDNGYKYLQYFMIMVKYNNDIEINDNYKCAYYGQAATLAPNESSVNLMLNCGSNKSNYTGRYVTIRRLGGNQPNKLALCDVKVFVKCEGMQCIESDSQTTVNPYFNGNGDTYWSYITMSWYSPSYPYYKYIYYRQYGLQAGDIAAIVLGIILFVVLLYFAWIAYKYLSRKRASQKQSAQYKVDDSSTAKKALIEHAY